MDSHSPVKKRKRVDSQSSLPSVASKSRLCMICYPESNPNEYHVYIFDIPIDESSLGDNHKIPPRTYVNTDYPVDPADVDVSSFEEEPTPAIVLVDFPRILACAVDSLLCFFPAYPSTEVLCLHMPEIGTRLNRHRVVYGEESGMLKKAPLNLVSPKKWATCTRYGTRFLVFTAQIRVHLSPDYDTSLAGDQFEIYHPYSEPPPPLKDLPNLLIYCNKLYNLETKSFEPLPFVCPDTCSSFLNIKTYSLTEHTFVVRTNFGRFCLDLENPTVRGWQLYEEPPLPWGCALSGQIYVARAHEHQMQLSGCLIYKDGQYEGDIPKSWIPVPLRDQSRFHMLVKLLDGFTYPRCTPCIIQRQTETGDGRSYMTLDVVRIDLSKLGSDEEWAEIIHSFKFCIKHQIDSMLYLCAIFPI